MKTSYKYTIELDLNFNSISKCINTESLVLDISDNILKYIRSIYKYEYLLDNETYLFRAKDIFNDSEYGHAISLEDSSVRIWSEDIADEDYLLKELCNEVIK